MTLPNPQNVLLAPLAFVAIALWVPASSFAQGIEELKHGVVKITATAVGGNRQIGTGFVVRVEPNAVYMVTAGHVIAGDSQPEVTFFSKNIFVRQPDPIRGSVLPGAQVDDDLRGLAVVVVRGSENIPDDVRALVFESSATLMSGGEEALVIGHPGGGGDWAIVKRAISNRVVHDLTLDPGVAPRFSGGPIILNEKVVGVVMSNRGEFGLGMTHHSVLNYLEGIGLKLVGAISPPDKKKTLDPQQPLPQIKTGKDGAPMVLVPAGEFRMGAPEGVKDIDLNEIPEHKVYLKDFYIDQYELTVEHYLQFLLRTKKKDPPWWDEVVIQRDVWKPVVGVNWQDAHDYCEWAGKRLPTEAEWEKVARGVDKRIYPWGEDTPNSSTANFGNNIHVGPLYAEKLENVGQYERGKSPYGAYDMAGNVWEWVQDWYDENYYRIGPRESPPGPPSGESKVVRGGSWFTNSWSLRSTFRFHLPPLAHNMFNGFRCAQDAR
ncbi:MAG: SUMF1/EgtB/PvdO family nonheme iron enzyme [Nitrospirota bacterium]|nr:SUMF1/EgtB/PvdO family nonheme iron enzyme [Nitrospirota bacterium]MDH5586492.1 SUMF1/EgtB/PvdO family nonheme iron enzyme [Nitrospirota bacterium]MDH5774426.1 SUMF1/EgtB/PvdO family nonheme iron enzyme [Nitrospirota bacterium]